MRQFKENIVIDDHKYIFKTVKRKYPYYIDVFL